MQTPSHIAVSLLLWSDSVNWKQTCAIVTGAFFPDVTMFVFYGYQKAIGSTESDIWNTLYFEESWQLFFDVFNSIPIFLLLAIVGYLTRQRILFLVSASALVHVLCDLPVHNDDAHRHFLPFSNWRFISPLSYWDPKHFGIYVMVTELLAAVSSCIYLTLGDFARSVRVSAAVNLALYAAAILAGLAYWISLS